MCRDKYQLCPDIKNFADVGVVQFLFAGRIEGELAIVSFPGAGSLELQLFLTRTASSFSSKGITLI
jgi:hypothetical protein